MPAKKHPILTVLILLGLLILFLGTTMFVAHKTVGLSSRVAFGDKIGVITIEGPITDSGEILSQLVEFRENRGIQAIVLRIDSPGGGVGPSQEIYQEVRRTVPRKTVVVSMGGVAASGGYYVASAATEIVANPGTITGSIGVIMEIFRFEELLNKLGVNLESVKSGEFKDIGSPARKMNARDREVLNLLIGDIQSQFVAAVAEGRNLPLEEVRKIADGRVFSGAQAMEMGLVDSLGNFRDAVDQAKRISGLKGDVTLVYPPKSRLGFRDLIFNSAAGFMADLFHRVDPLQYKWDGTSGVHR
jgi:protease IV